MTREEKADKLGQEYFPDESNIYARPNYEAQWVSEACMKMAEWERKRLVDMACEWLKSSLDYVEDCIGDIMVCSVEHETVEEFIAAFRQAMEGGAE